LGSSLLSDPGAKFSAENEEQGQKEKKRAKKKETQACGNRRPQTQEPVPNLFQAAIPGLKGRISAQEMGNTEEKRLTTPTLLEMGRYTHRVAISNHRLVSFADGTVTFRWRDSAHNNEQKLLPLSVDEFLRRFLLHLLPQGFVRIRNFGFLANRRRATTLPLCFQLLGSAQQAKVEVSTASSSDAWLCPKCGGPMLVIERLTAAEIQLRSPPSRDAIAA
jgi:hypothetical protein